MKPKVVKKKTQIQVTKWVERWYIKDERGHVHYGCPHKSEKDAKAHLKRLLRG